MNDPLALAAGLLILLVILLVLVDMRRKPKRKKYPHRPGELADIQQRLLDIKRDSE
jgi:hypothetical protein